MNKLNRLTCIETLITISDWIRQPALAMNRAMQKQRRI
ncbi:hypothetical protein NSE_0379 [Neorickettsia sennetsu str. Miyayama]|uniref:Uncharacterized protein n=1 Tax=Ehrlichia sennetsu (strain ATCC VR-367 / Miyayama) TaxID=222891 RepID=Q2GE28_EHRS3|nr:hypothetical protein NSE_0379 [Neorickettsia sennetsu str. Miyayama]